MNIALELTLAKMLPIGEIKATIEMHTGPMTKQLPDKRLKRVIEDMVLGIMGSETPVITEMARQNSKDDGESWAVAKRMYRLLENKQVQTSQIYEGLYQAGCEAVAREKPEYLVAAVDPVNFEKPYVKTVEGASIVHKATPARPGRSCPSGTWLSGHHCYHCEHQSTGNQLRQLVFVRDRLYQSK